MDANDLAKYKAVRAAAKQIETAIKDFTKSKKDEKWTKADSTRMGTLSKQLKQLEAKASKLASG